MKYFLAFFISVLALGGRSQPDSVHLVMQSLNDSRQSVQSTTFPDPGIRLEQLLDLGMWEEARTLIGQASSQSEWFQVQAGRYYLLNHEFQKARDQIALLPHHSPGVITLKAELAIHAWDLDKADSLLKDLDATSREFVLAGYLKGKVLILRKQYDQALAWAKQILATHPDSGKGFLLMGEALFWLEDMEGAEKALKASLEAEPLDADARFWYGYAIWRQVDATRLPDMAAQWELALELNPLHYFTHWHWGNGHTHLTFEDYADSFESPIVKALEPAEKWISQNHIDSAVWIGRQVAKRYPESVYPDMFLGSAWYMNYDMPLHIRLDSAMKTFLGILGRKPHYGPAHNAVAAVIKARRFSFLNNYAELEANIDSTRIADPALFEAVFPDMSYYPGDRVQKMIWNQLFAARAYFPMLQKLGRKFVIPPLHTDLATAMKSPYFRGNTTFDNRQWMDIRGVGSGATGIEYVERGAHQERNVTLHEYVHLFHMTVFSDQEKRRVRELYANARKNGLTLDYYAANNEHEYLAQTYTAYFAPVKVHPLNHKSVNTRKDLIDKDPQLYAFLDSLVARQMAFLGGDEAAMATNWAQVFLNMANQAMKLGKVTDRTWAWLDTAASYDPGYVPVPLARVRAHLLEGQQEEAKTLILDVMDQHRDYAPVHVMMAEVFPAFKKAHLQNAFALEKDFAEKANIQKQLREALEAEGLYHEAISIAESYAAETPGFSTYLRDRKREAIAFANLLKAKWGYAREPLAFFEKQIALRPQDYTLRIQYADALIALDRQQEAWSVLDEGYKLLLASGRPMKSYATRLAILAAQKGDLERAHALKGQGRGKPDPVLSTRFLRATGQLQETENSLESLEDSRSLNIQAEYRFQMGESWMEKGKQGKARKAYQAALELNPYHWEATKALLELLSPSRREGLIEKVCGLPLSPGEVIQAELKPTMQQTTLQE